MIKTILGHKIQDSLVVFLGQVGRLLLSMISSALLARGLGVVGLSYFSVVGAVMMIGLTVADFGLSTSAVRYLAAGREPPEQAQNLAAIFARLKMGAAVGLWLVVVALSRPVAQWLGLPAGDGPQWVMLGSLGFVATSLSGVVSTVLQAHSRFQLLIVTQTANIVLTVVLFGGLFLGHRLTVVSALWVGIGTALLTAGWGYWGLSGDWRRALWRPVTSGGGQTRLLLGLGKWLWLATLLSILYTQLDLLLVNRLLDPHTAGLYALALNLSLKATIIAVTLHIVLLPQVSVLNDPAGYFTFLKQSTGRTIAAAFGLLLLLPFANPFVSLLYGPEFRPAVPAFNALLLVVILDIFLAQLLLLALPMEMPRLTVLANGVQLLCLTLLGLWLIPHWGVAGVIVAKIVGKVVGVSVALWPIGRRLTSSDN